MSNPIPPFVCSTPPPIDCIADAPPPVEDDFGDFAAVDEQFVASSLPVTPVHVAKAPNDISSIPIPHDTPPLPEIDLAFVSENNAESPPVDIQSPERDADNLFQAPDPPIKPDLTNDLPFIIENNSPPPLDLEPVDDDDLTPCDDLENDDEADEFPPDDVNKYDDNISLPSLKFDSLSNVSKSTTPVSDELTKSHHEDSDSIGTFRPIPARDLDGEANTTSEENSTEETLPKEKQPTSDECKTAAQTPSESENLESFSILQQPSDGHESDFTEFETFSPIDEPKVVNSEPSMHDSITVKDDPQSNDFAFEADFSQFSSSEPAVASQVIEPKPPVEKSSLNDLEADDFDDFQDFALATPVAIVNERKPSIDKTTNQETPGNQDEDDDFGEFSEVIESNSSSNSIPSSNNGFNLNNLNEKLKPILEMMFPLTQNDIDDDKQQLTAVLTTSINQIDTAKALEYQWSNSEVRHSLIKSLGVDSRNILYGEKWNSSMPRYAANLSFNPLEPMKPDRKSTSSSLTSTTSSTTTAVHRKRSGSLTSTASVSKGVVDVPAVEFDWNSSGLVNPLDGVKEILHEGAIETLHASQPGDTNSSVDQQSSTAVTNNNNNNNDIYDTDKPVRRFFDDETISTAIELKPHADASATVSTTTIPTTAAAAATTTTTAPSPAATATPASAITTALPNDYIDITGGDLPPSVLEPHLDTVRANSPALNHTTTHTAKYQEISKTDLETELKHSGVVTTSTFAGPLKETHIFTPSKTDTILARSSSKTPRTSESKCPIDFDYEIAAAGIIIDEAVVKKEYRDVEYNPGFGSKYREDPDTYNHISSVEIERDHPFSSNGPTKHSYLNDNFLEPTPAVTEQPPGLDDFCDFVSVASDKKTASVKTIVPNNNITNNSFDDEFSDFQSVPAPVAPPVPVPTIVPPPSIIPSSVTTESKSSPSHLRKLKESELLSSSGSRTGTPVSLNDEMILSPAILLPQTIQLQENQPKIDWPEPGINPEELARIEELFPQPKTNNSNSKKSSPSHSVSVRSQKTNHQQKQQSRTTPPQPVNVDDDDWSDFVSVPAVGNRIQSISQQFQKSKASPAKSLVSETNDDEWSDFVSSAPPPPQRQQIPNHLCPGSSFPQFNSGAWQCANFYNNPMSAYASPPTSFYYQLPQQPQQQQQQQNLSNNLVPNLSNLNNNPVANNNSITNSNNNNPINQYSFNNQVNPNQQHHNSHHHLQQHIQMMHDYSSSGTGHLSSHLSTQQQYAAMPVTTSTGLGYSNRTSMGGLMQNHHANKSSQFVGGSSKVAPSISLIPDLGFVAPTHTSFISVPKSSFMTKK